MRHETDRPPPPTPGAAVPAEGRGAAGREPAGKAAAQRRNDMVNGPTSPERGVSDLVSVSQSPLQEVAQRSALRPGEVPWRSHLLPVMTH